MIMNIRHTVGVGAVCFLLATAWSCSMVVPGAEEGSRHVFIDAGAQDGVSLLAFQTTELYKQHPWEVIAIEADTTYIPLLSDLPGVTKVIGKAMWLYDGYIEFNVSEKAAGGSLWAESGPLDDVRVGRVECFDFGKWLMQNFKKEDHVILSMDITGAEYQILDKMVKDGSIQFVDELYVEFSDVEEFDDFSEVIKSVDIKNLVRILRASGILKGMDSVEDCIKEGLWVPCSDYDPLQDPSTF